LAVAETPQRAKIDLEKKGAVKNVTSKENHFLSLLKREIEKLARLLQEAERN